MSRLIYLPLYSSLFSCPFDRFFYVLLPVELQYHLACESSCNPLERKQENVTFCTEHNTTRNLIEKLFHFFFTDLLVINAIRHLR